MQNICPQGSLCTLRPCPISTLPVPKGQPQYQLQGTETITAQVPACYPVQPTLYAPGYSPGQTHITPTREDYRSYWKELGYKENRKGNVGSPKAPCSEQYPRFCTIPRGFQSSHLCARHASGYLYLPPGPLFRSGAMVFQLSRYPLSRLGVTKEQSDTTDDRPDTEGQHRLTNVIGMHTFQESPVCWASMPPLA